MARTLGNRAGSRPSRDRGGTGAAGGSGADCGLSLIEVLIAMAILAMIAGFLFQLRLDAVRHALAQRRHTALSQLLRSEAETLRAGAGAEGTCASLDAASAAEGFTCEVRQACTFPVAVCGAAPGLVGWVIAAAPPGEPPVEVRILVRANPGRWIVTQK